MIEDVFDVKKTTSIIPKTRSVQAFSYNTSMLHTDRHMHSRITIAQAELSTC